METMYTTHPDPNKQGVSINSDKYHCIRYHIEHILRKQGAMSFTALCGAIVEEIGGTFEGSVPWYFTTVKLDLEARGIIERVPGQRRQYLRLTGSSDNSLKPQC